MTARAWTGPVLTCPAGQYTSIQAAVNAAIAGDWILVAPGDYHEKADTTAGVHITTPNLHLRGMDRNGVVVDGTKATATGQCSSAAADQDTNGGHGRSGIEVFKVDGTSVDNLTACNYLTGDAHATGNEIWWNGGDTSGHIGMNSYSGSYITGTTTYSDSTNQGSYGIFVSNSDGPGTISYAYASNMADSGFYVGACPDCNATLNHVHSENNVLGYSGTNAGGHLNILNSEWDLNKSGIVPNSLNNDDAPPPQSGLCPASTTLSCTLIARNLVHDNNNPNTPGPASRRRRRSAPASSCPARRGTPSTATPSTTRRAGASSRTTIPTPRLPRAVGCRPARVVSALPACAPSRHRAT